MKYRYSGPTSGVTLKDGDALIECMLFDGGEVELPEAHEYTRTLVARGHLTPLAESVKSKSKGAQQ